MLLVKNPENNHYFPPSYPLSFLLYWGTLATGLDQGQTPDYTPKRDETEVGKRRIIINELYSFGNRIAE
jgi:hypothetical protein